MRHICRAIQISYMLVDFHVELSPSMQNIFLEEISPSRRIQVKALRPGPSNSRGSRLHAFSFRYITMILTMRLNSPRVTRQSVCIDVSYFRAASQQTTARERQIMSILPFLFVPPILFRQLCPTPRALLPNAIIKTQKFSDQSRSQVKVRRLGR